jgi:hypothetical protein
MLLVTYFPLTFFLYCFSLFQRQKYHRCPRFRTSTSSSSVAIAIAITVTITITVAAAAAAVLYFLSLLDSREFPATIVCSQ